MQFDVVPFQDINAKLKPLKVRMTESQFTLLVLITENDECRPSDPPAVNRLLERHKISLGKYPLKLLQNDIIGVCPPGIGRIVVAKVYNYVEAEL